MHGQSSKRRSSKNGRITRGTIKGWKKKTGWGKLKTEERVWIKIGSRSKNTRRITALKEEASLNIGRVAIKEIKTTERGATKEARINGSRLEINDLEVEIGIRRKVETGSWKRTTAFISWDRTKKIGITGKSKNTKRKRHPGSWRKSRTVKDPKRKISLISTVLRFDKAL